jgi:hypothetical protein
MLACDGPPPPAAFVATTVNVYEVPGTRPVTVQDVPVVVQDAPPGEAVTLYEVICEPPLAVGAVQLTVTAPIPADAITFVGAPGAPVGATGVTALLGADGELLPCTFVATTVNVYAVPLLRPVSVHDVVAVVHVTPPGDDVTV